MILAPQRYAMQKLDELLIQAAEAGASDVYLVADGQPKCRMAGSIAPLEEPFDAQAACLQILKSLNDHQRQRFKQLRAIEFSRVVRRQLRVRYHLHVAHRGLAAVCHLCPETVPTIDSLGLPEALGELADLHDGLVLVVGRAGSGRSTTLAAMVDHINENHRRHIVTIDDPLEYRHSPKQSMVTQLGSEERLSTETVFGVVRRLDADLVVMDPLEGRSAIDAALTLSISGRLVLAAMTSGSASTAVEQLYIPFDEDEQPEIDAKLAHRLRAMVVQQLLPRKSGVGRVAAIEILMATDEVIECFRSGVSARLHELLSAKNTSTLQSMDDALARLLEKDLIDESVAKRAARDKKRFERQPG